MQRGSGSVSPLQAMVVIAVFGLLLGLWVWARGQLMAVPLPMHMTSLHDTGALVSYRHQLFLVQADGQVIPGAEFPQISPSAGLAGAEDGTVFVYLGGDSESTTDRTSSRRKGLYRCHWKSGECTLFNNQLVPHGSIRLAWDVTRQQLAVVDTHKHQLRVLDRSGKIVQIVSGFRYPNGLSLQASQWLVADTNHHRIAAVDPSGKEDPASVLKVDPEPDHVWPTDVATVGKQYWVLAATSNSNPFAVLLASTVSSNLAYGRLYRYDRQWQLLGRSATSLSDIASMAALGNGALAFDLSQRSLWQLNASGQALREIRLPGMVQANDDFQQWASIVDGALVLFIIALVLGFAWAIHDAHQRKATAALNPRHNVPVATEQAGGTSVETWLQPVGFLRYGPALLIVLIVAFVGWLSYLLSLIKPFDIELLVLMLTMVVLAVSPLPMLHYARRCKLGVLGSSVRIRTPDGRTVAAEGVNIAMNRHLIAIDDVLLPIRNRYGTPYWEPDKMAQWVLPQLQKARRFRVLEVWKISWRTSFWPLLFPAACVFVAVLMLVAVKLP